MPDANRIAAAINLRVRQLEAQGIRGKALVDPMLGYMKDLQWIYETLSDRALIDLCRLYPGFECYARIMEDFAEHGRALEAAGTHPYQGMPALSEGPLKASLEKLLRDGVELEREFQDMVDRSRVNQVDRINALRQQWAVDLANVVQAFRTSGLPARAQAMIQQVLIDMAQRIDRLAKG